MLLGIYLIFILPLQLPNAGESGLSLPQNLLAWSVITLCIAVSLLRTVYLGQLWVGRFMLFAAAGALFLVLPWGWTSCQLWQKNALPQLAGIGGALLFLLVLCQQHLTAKMRRRMVKIIAFATLVQALTAMAEAWIPGIILQLTGSLPHGVVGVFQQRNVLGSWLATGIGLILYLALTSCPRQRAVGWVLLLYPLLAALVLSESRASLLGGAITIILAALADKLVPDRFFSLKIRPQDATLVQEEFTSTFLQHLWVEWKAITIVCTDNWY